MNKKVLAAAIAATCALGAVHTEADAAKKAKNQSLGDLSCLANQVAEFDGELWACIDTPSGGDSDAPEYDLVDGDGNILGDVTYIENGFTAWGYINDLSTSSTIQVTATYNKSGRQADRLAGNLKSVRVWYESADCSGPGYLADYELGANYWGPYTGEPTPFPHFLTFLETEKVYYLPDIRSNSESATTWTEVIMSSSTGVHDFESFNLTSDVNNCTAASLAGISASQIDSFGIPFDAPVMPISVVKK